MSEQRYPASNRPPAKERFQRNLPQGEPRLDRDRAIAELKRFLELAVREMGLDVTFEITTAPPAEAGRDEADVLVTFGGADQELLLEGEADLLLSLEHIAHRWLRLD